MSERARHVLLAVVTAGPELDGRCVIAPRDHEDLRQ
jgi:hypothetical protein